MPKSYDALVLFSGGLDSLLTARLLMAQGLRILCLHFYTPFFGDPARAGRWSRIWELEIEAIDASQPFLRMFAAYPPHGVGKTLNPCVDCKITLLKLAKELMPAYGAKFLATGEVVGQRPMSQRTDALNVIAKASETAGILLRPLCAKHLRPTPMEESGLVRRELLCDFSGRGRNGQLALAASLGITEIPAPAGGCKLTERENARRYWQLLRSAWLGGDPDLVRLRQDFDLVNHGRILFHAASGAMLCIGRRDADNAAIRSICRAGDYLLRLPFPGPLALLRASRCQTPEIFLQAADILCGYAPKTRLGAVPIPVALNGPAGRSELLASPDRHDPDWILPSWPETAAEIHEFRRRAAQFA